MKLMGVNEQEAQQFAGAVAQRGGGNLADLEGTGLLRAGMAAQTAFGVGQDVTGTFLGAARRGGLTGGVGKDTMAQSIGDAMSLGLQGSEITDYLEAMAEGIEQWRQTGIELNRDSMRDMSAAFAGTGLGVVQGQRVARGVQARAGQIATGGPQTAIDMMMMQAAGFQGGGIESFQETRQKLAGGMDKETTEKFIKILTAGTEGTAGAALQSAMSQLGITMTPEMAQALQAAGQGGPKTPEQEAAISQFQAQANAGRARAPGTQAGLEAQARGTVAAMGPNLRDQAAIQNMQLDVGAKLAPAMLAFEKTTTTTAGTMASFNKEIEAAAKMSLEFAQAMQEFVKLMRNKGIGSALGEVFAP
jgi:hypothetical protein